MERYNFLSVEKKWRKNVSANSVKNNNSKKVPEIKFPMQTPYRPPTN